MSTTVRVSEATRDRVAAIAASTGRQMQSVLDEAVEAYERELFWQRVNDAYEELAADPVAWAEIEAEREGQAPSLRDGLD